MCHTTVVIEQESGGLTLLWVISFLQRAGKSVGEKKMNHSDYQRIEEAISFLEKYATEQPTLDEVAEHIGLSPFHFQRLFKRWAGISPKRFLQFLTVENAKQLLRNSASVLDTSYEVGLSGPGRLHDLFVSVDAVTPGEFKFEGRTLELRYSFRESPFGECLVAETPRGICHLGFVDGDDKGSALEALRNNWKEATIREDSQAGRKAVKQLFAPAQGTEQESIKVLLKGTNFQLKVWEALLRIPKGAVVSYGNIANAVGCPNAHRAVGTAVGQNPVAYLIPCHRVLRASGEIGGYRWGTARKRVLLATEGAASTAP